MNEVISYSIPLDTFFRILKSFKSSNSNFLLDVYKAHPARDHVCKETLYRSPNTSCLPPLQSGFCKWCLQGFSLFSEARSHALILRESRLLAKIQGFENLGPLRAARLPAMKQRSEPSAERCGTDSGRVGNSQTLTCSRPNGDLVAKKPWSPGSPMSCTLGITTAAWFLHFQNKSVLIIWNSYCYFFLSLLLSQEIQKINSHSMLKFTPISGNWYFANTEKSIFNQLHLWWLTRMQEKNHCN